MLAFPMQEACTTDTNHKENDGVAGLGKILVAEFAETISPRVVDEEASEHSEADEREPSSTSSVNSSEGTCVGGFCTYSDEKQKAWEREQQESKPDEQQGVPMLAGLAVATFDVTKSSTTAMATPSASAAAAASSLPVEQDEQSKAAVHPETERRRREREARKAHRRGSSQMMSKKEWWKTSAANLVEVDSESAFSEVIESAASQGQTVIVDYYAPWCQACARQFPEIVSAAMGNPNIVFLKVNAGNLRAMCEAQGVQRLPSYGVIEPGKEFWCTGFIQKLHDIMGTKRQDCLI